MTFSVAMGDHAGNDAAPYAGLPLAAVAEPPEKVSCSSCAARQTGLCSAITTKDTADLSTISRTKKIVSGTIVMDEGETADAVFTVVSGMLKLYKTLPDGRQQITGFATVGDVVGLAFGKAYGYTAEAITTSMVCRIASGPLTKLMERSPAVQARLLAMTSVELTAAQDQILLLGCKTSNERVCSFLLALARRSAKGDGGQATVYLPMRKTDIGGYLGLRPETLSRVFRRLEDAGHIARVGNDCIQLKDLTALGAAASVED